MLLFGLQMMSLLAFIATLAFLLFLIWLGPKLKQNRIPAIGIAFINLVMMTTILLNAFIGIPPQLEQLVVVGCMSAIVITIFIYIRKTTAR
jgi:hypothetical protein